MKKLYDKNELTFALVWIGIYVLSFSVADGLSAKLGTEKLLTAFVGLALTIGLFVWTCKQGLGRKMGLIAPEISPKQVLYYIPLALIPTVNLWLGAHMNFSFLEICLYVFSMLCVGFLEELIFRGFLFKALCKDSLKTAIIVSSVTFGAGHIVNLLNGAELVSTLLQIVYAIAIGFSFTYLFLVSGSIWPCIICHGVINGLSAFAPADPSLSNSLLSAAFLCVVSVGYGLYLAKNFPLSELDEKVF